MNEHPWTKQEATTESPEETTRRPKKNMTLAGVIYWQMLVALFGFVVSLGIQFQVGLPLLVDVLCGAEGARIDAARCSEAVFRSTFLVSLAFSSAIFVALGASIVGSFRESKGSFLFSLAATYLFFAFLASMQKDYFINQALGIGGNSAYQLAIVAIAGALIAAVSYHVPKWLLGQARQHPQTTLAESEL